jgi:hypothetical protein
MSRGGDLHNELHMVVFLNACTVYQITGLIEYFRDMNMVQHTLLKVKAVPASRKSLTMSPLKISAYLSIYQMAKSINQSRCWIRP